MRTYKRPCSLQVPFCIKTLQILWCCIEPDLLLRIATSKSTQHTSMLCLPDSLSVSKNFAALSSGSSARIIFTPSGSSSFGGGASRPLSSDWCEATAKRRQRNELNVNRGRRILNSPFLLAASWDSCEGSWPLWAAFLALDNAFFDASVRVSKQSSDGRRVWCTKHANQWKAVTICQGTGHRKVPPISK